MKNPVAFVVLILLSLVYTAALVYYPGVILTAVGAFSGGSFFPHSPMLREISSFMLFAYPISIIIAYFCWWAYHKRKFKLAYVLVCLPLVWVMITGALLLAA
ncbi:hypothetical protein EJP77_19205 [Paenibacillus zeisoli]|uniref:Uncharacterized protein n=1 Tax=Paenibacillus zeisoli TaxID=2496267 RepID=A0A3S1D6V2_9BACL|nr:hypothetical protein [Paenibacillus zeisoli]RUT27962.1 hypothetical protein EJP77_19205 [Paenibacillus zeisoli]